MELKIIYTSIIVFILCCILSFILGTLKTYKQKQQYEKDKLLYDKPYLLWKYAIYDYTGWCEYIQCKDHPNFDSNNEYIRIEG